MGKKKKSPSLNPEIQGLWMLALAVSILISEISYALGHETNNLLGMMGYSIGWMLFGLFGLSSFALTLFLGWVGWRFLFNKKISALDVKTFAVVLFAVSLSMLLCLIEDTLRGRSQLGGSLFWYLYHDLPHLNLNRAVSAIGVSLVFSSTLIASLLILFKISPYWLYEGLKSLFSLPQPPRVVKVETIPDLPEIEPLLASAPKKRVIHTPKAEKEAPPKPIVKDDGSYRLPPLTLLSSPKKIDQTSLKQNLNKQAEILEEALMSFGLEAKVGQINCGPTITSFEVHPAIGVKVQKIKTLENDIALNMEAKSIRIIAPIPGKAAVGIEVPNPQPQEVSFKEMLQAYQALDKKFKIPILLGKQVNGEWVMSDLSKMPHCIIAGATGSGKSVCINTIVMSIVMNARPDEIRLVMVDPKKVELTAYTRLPHMLAPVITEPKEALLALNWLVKEMERRYEIFKLLGTRNIEAFNQRKPNPELEKSLDIEIPTHLPYFVAIIDELADLMMVSSSDIETPIARIAQMARAVGIHLILATQRPSREVITGLIKANFPTRISFKVASRINSQIILDDTGAESLLGNGDMLFLPPGTSHLIRAQGAFIRDEDIQAVIQECEKQAPTNYAISSFSDIAAQTSEEDEASNDPLYEQAKEVVLSTGNASTTFLQRKLKLGYARAANLIDQLEARGIVGPQEGARPRKVIGARKSAYLEDEEL